MTSEFLTFISDKMQNLLALLFSITRAQYLAENQQLEAGAIGLVRMSHLPRPKLTHVPCRDCCADLCVCVCAV